MIPPNIGRRAGLTIGLLCCLCVSCSDDREGSLLVCEDLQWSGEDRARNVILIVNDTMRRDRMAPYGGPARTPVFDAFARQHLLFEQGYTQSPWTRPSMATLFTSLYPSQHGVMTHPKPQTGETVRLESLSSSVSTLAETLNDAGYRTAAFVANPWMRRGFGFEQGFEVYDDSFAAWDTPGSSVSRAGQEWLDGIRPGERFFLYLHYMDSHRPYPPLSRWEILTAAERLRGDDRPLTKEADSEILEIVHLAEGIPAAATGIPASVALAELAYDGGIEQFDRALGRFLETLATREAYADTAIVVTSDHGEALYDRGYGNHGNGLYDDELGVPLAARLPGVTAGAPPVRCPSGLIDLMPTLCTYLDVACPAPTFGVSLLERTRSGEDLRYVVTEGVAHKPGNRAIRDGVHKLLWQPQPGPDGKGHALFDYREDPRELRDLLAVAERTTETEEVLGRLSRALREAIPEFATPEAGSEALSLQEIERLRSLGYLD
jgi:arylsulfatase